MAMLLTVLGVAAPSLSRFFRGRALESEARRFLALTRHAQSRAVSEGIPMVLWVNEDLKTYGLHTEAAYTDMDEKSVDFELARDLKIEVSLMASQTNGAMQTLQSRTNSVLIRFLPDGYLNANSPEYVVLREREEDEIWITQSRNRLNYEIQTNKLVIQNLSR
jgi:Tfp pilus assembly protein FimT